MKRIIITILFVSLFTACKNNEAKNPFKENDFYVFKFKDVNETKVFFKWRGPKRLISAHRGGPYPGIPENCIATFENIIRKTPAIIECDIAVSKDGKLVMMHDDKLDRTTNGQGFVKDYTWEELRQLTLVDNEGDLSVYQIPTLNEVLLWTKEKAFLTLDIKKGVSYESVNQLIKETESEAYVAIIAYNIKAAKKIHAINPNLMISVPGRNMDDIDRIKTSNIPVNNLIAFTGVREPKQIVYEALHEMNIYCMLGSLGNLDKKAEARGDHIYLDLFQKGADVLATDRPLEVAKLISQ